MLAKAFFASYIVRIYRFNKNKPGSLVGVVEEAGTKLKKAFTNYDELWNILIAPKNIIQKRKSDLPALRGAKRKEVKKEGRFE